VEQPPFAVSKTARLPSAEKFGLDPRSIRRRTGPPSGDTTRYRDSCPVDDLVVAWRPARTTSRHVARRHLERMVLRNVGDPNLVDTVSVRRRKCPASIHRASTPARGGTPQRRDEPCLAEGQRPRPRQLPPDQTDGGQQRDPRPAAIHGPRFTPAV
jgi:hypothetical protein